MLLSLPASLVQSGGLKALSRIDVTSLWGTLSAKLSRMFLGQEAGRF
jgi:hypothetical protein